MRVSGSTEHSIFTYRHFRYILKSALEGGYEFIGFDKLARLKRNNRLVCLLRHDCDNDLQAAAAMAQIEQEMGLRATYFVMLRSAMYNVLSIPNAQLVREILGRGHFLGLHFDEQCYLGANQVDTAKFVDRERSLLSHEFAVPVNVVSFHQPSPKVLASKVRINCINTYDRLTMRGVYYVSDSNTIWKDRCPCELFRERNLRSVQLLIHPEWWTPQQMSLRRKWNRMLRNNFELTQKSLLKRERTYTQHQTPAFRLSG